MCLLAAEAERAVRDDSTYTVRAPCNRIQTLTYKIRRNCQPNPPAHLAPTESIKMKTFIVPLVAALANLTSAVCASTAQPSIAISDILKPLTQPPQSCVQSLEVDRCFDLAPDVPAINTLSEARIVNNIYNGDVRVENLNGTFAMIDHTNSKHIGLLRVPHWSTCARALMRWRRGRHRLVPTMLVRLFRNVGLVALFATR